MGMINESRTTVGPTVDTNCRGQHFYVSIAASTAASFSVTAQVNIGGVWTSVGAAMTAVGATMVLEAHPTMAVRLSLDTIVTPGVTGVTMVLTS